MRPDEATRAGLPTGGANAAVFRNRINAFVARLVSGLSTRFTGLPVDDVGGEIERALRLFVEILGTDRSTFYLSTPMAAWP